MRLVVYTFCLPAIAATGWKLGAWCGDTFIEGLEAYSAKWARKSMKKKLTVAS